MPHPSEMTIQEIQEWAENAGTFTRAVVDRLTETIDGYAAALEKTQSKAPAWKHVDTSQEAAESIRYKLTGRRRNFLAVIIRAEPSGITAKAAGEKLGLPHNSASPRIRELAHNGWIERVGKVGKPAAYLWRVTQLGRDAYEVMTTS